MKAERFYLGASLIFILLMSLGGGLIITKTGYPSGSDINLHLRLAEGWLKGEAPLFNQAYFNNNYPYPPAFHLTLAFFSFLFFTSPLAVVKVFQVFLYPAIFLSTFYLVYRKAGIYAGAVTVLLLATSPALWDRGSQIIPQAVDLFVFPVAAYLFLQKKNGLFILAASFMFYNHSVYAALPLFSLFLYSLIYEKERLGVFLKILLLSLPLIIVIGAHLEAILAESTSINEEQEGAVLEEPLFAIKYLGYPLFFLLFTVPIHLLFKKADNLNVLLILWILSLSPMGIYFPDRFLQYLAQPASALGAIAIADIVPHEKRRLALFLMLLIFALAVQHNLFTTVVQNGEVLMPLNNLSPFVI